MGIFGTSAGLFADISLILEAVILAIFLIGWRYVKKGQTNLHYKIMASAFSLNLIFVGTYMIRSLIKEGSTSFMGPENIKDFVYLPTVIVHGIASIAAFVLAGYTVYYGYTRSVQKKQRLFADKSNRKFHRLFGILTISTWTLAFATGFIVYLLLYVFY